ncbi:MAG: VanZ family protein [Candidatus Omnitrophota bacterium]|nr:VanZ family protein [Candidatus Omnitrophota bacterium]
MSSLEEPLNVDLEIGGLDKILHIAEYSGLGFLLARAIGGTSGKKSAMNVALITFILGTLYGVTDEFHQQLTPGRFVSILDLVSDAIGSFFGAVTFIAFQKN